MEFQWRRVVCKEYKAGFDWFSATALVVLINLWRGDLLDEHVVLTALMALVTAVRIVLYLAARQMNKQTPTAAAGA
jgi:hypothetical protein